MTIPGGRDRDPVAPTRDDAVARAAAPAVGGVIGAHAGRHPWWTPVRVVLMLTAVAFVVGMVQKQPCVDTGWNDGRVRYTHMCYSDLPYLYTGRGLVEGNWPYTDDEQVRARYPQVMEYPPVISYWAWGTAELTLLITGADVAERYDDSTSVVASRTDVQHEQLVFVTVNAVGFALLALLSAWLLAGASPRRPWDAAAFALLPALALTGLVNWDLLVIALVAGALWAWQHDRPVLLGILLGVGTATKLFPLFLLGPVLVLYLRGRQWGSAAAVTVFTAVGWGVANLPAYLSSPQAWKVFWTFNSDRGADLGSLWLVWQQATDTVLYPYTINVWSWVFLLGWCLVVAVLGFAAPRPPRLAQLALLVVAGFLLVNKVYSPQYVLWLLPLAVLARPRWRDLLIWQAGEVFYFAAVWWYLAGELAPGAGEDAGMYWIAIIVRVLAELWLIGVVVRDIVSPRADPVERRTPWDGRRSGHDDPVEPGRGEADADVDLLAHRGHA